MVERAGDLHRGARLLRSLAGPLLRGDRRRAEHAGLRAVAGEPDLGLQCRRPAPCGGARCARPGTSSRSPASDTPPPITTSSGSNVLIAFAMPMPEPLAEHADDVLAVHVALARALDRVVAGDLVALGEPAAEERLRVRAGRLEREPVERAAGGERLERAGLREGARVGRRAVGEVEADHRVAQLGGARRAAVELAVQHEAAADAGADREHDEVLGDDLAGDSDASASAAHDASFST